jgi:hypothetical protein
MKLWKRWFPYVFRLYFTYYAYVLYRYLDIIIFFIFWKFTIYTTNWAISKYVIRKHLCGALIQWWFSYVYCMLCCACVYSSSSLWSLSQRWYYNERNSRKSSACGQNTHVRYKSDRHVSGLKENLEWKRKISDRSRLSIFISTSSKTCFLDLFRHEITVTSVGEKKPNRRSWWNYRRLCSSLNVS